MNFKTNKSLQKNVSFTYWFERIILKMKMKNFFIKDRSYETPYFYISVLYYNTHISLQELNSKFQSTSYERREYDIFRKMYEYIYIFYLLELNTYQEIYNNSSIPSNFDKIYEYNYAWFSLNFFLKRKFLVMDMHSRRNSIRFHIMLQPHLILSFYSGESCSHPYTVTAGPILVLCLAQDTHSF